MNILIDCLSLMTRNGAAEYLRRVIEELLQSGKIIEMSFSMVCTTRVMALRTMMSNLI
jgi:hypothetical protein